jgi:hypothetical protein
MRRLAVAILMLAVLIVGLTFVAGAQQAGKTKGGPVVITVDEQGKVSVANRTRYPGKPPEGAVTVYSNVQPLPLIVFFNNPPGCVYIPSLMEWWC